MVSFKAADAARTVQRYRAKCEGDTEDITGLNITAMMDMMTILLVFLLKSFAVSTGLIAPSESDLKLPKSSVAMAPSNYLVVSITRKGIAVEGQQVVGVFAGEVESPTPPTKEHMEIRELKEALSLIGDAHEREAESAGRPFERKMLLVADKDTTYFLIVSVLHTASLAKFLKYQLVVVSTTAE